MDDYDIKVEDFLVYSKSVNKNDALIIGGVEVQEPTLNKDKKGRAEYIIWYTSCGISEENLPKENGQEITSGWSCSKDVGKRLYKGMTRGYITIIQQGGNYKIQKYCCKETKIPKQNN